MKFALHTDNVVIGRPKSVRQNICLDRGYDSEIGCGVGMRGYIGHIRKGEQMVRKTHTAKRWVVERTASWYNRFRKLLIRFEKKDANYLVCRVLTCVLRSLSSTLNGSGFPARNL